MGWLSDRARQYTSHVHRFAPSSEQLARYDISRLSQSEGSLDIPSCECTARESEYWLTSQSFVFFAVIVLAVWNVPDGLKFCAFYFGGFSGMASPILYSFVNSQLKENYGERGCKHHQTWNITYI